MEGLELSLFEWFRDEAFAPAGIRLSAEEWGIQAEFPDGHVESWPDLDAMAVGEYSAFEATVKSDEFRSGMVRALAAVGIPPRLFEKAGRKKDLFLEISRKFAGCGSLEELAVRAAAEGFGL